jgi:hypothetical protein
MATTTVATVTTESDFVSIPFDNFEIEKKCVKPLIRPQLCCDRLVNYFNLNPWTPLASFLFSYSNLQYLAEQMLLLDSTYVPGCKIQQAVYPCGQPRPECTAPVCVTKDGNGAPMYRTGAGAGAPMYGPMFQFEGNNYAQPIRSNCCGVGAPPPVPHWPTVTLPNGQTRTPEEIYVAINDLVVPELLNLYESYYERPTAFNNPCLWQEVNDRFLQRQREYVMQATGTAQLYNKYFINRTTNGSMLVFPYPSISGENVKRKNTRGFSAEQLALRKNDPSLQCLSANNYSLTDPSNRFLNDYRASVLLCYP